MKRFFFVCLCAVAVILSPLGHARSAAHAQEAQKAKNVILVLPDGLGFGGLTLLINYSYLYKKQPLAINQLMEQGNTGYCLTTPMKYVVPEGSSGITEIATGVKTDLLRVSVDDKDNKLTTIAELAKEKGRSVGIVTSHRVSHYTTGAFNAHVKTRAMENDIASQLADADVDVLLGGGIRNWIPKGKKASDVAALSENCGANEQSARADDADLIARAAARGYQLAFTQADLDKVAGGKVLGLFAGSSFPFVIDLRSAKETSAPSLAQMTAKAIDLLKGNEKGFFLVVAEGGIDQLLHENDPAGVLAQLVAFDEAVKVIADFAAQAPDTLVVVASSHDVGGVTFSAREDKTLAIENDFGSPQDFGKLDMQRKSSHALLQEMGKDPSSLKIKQVISDSTAYDLTNEEAMWIKVFPADAFFPKYMGYPYGALGKIIGKKTGIVWASQYHTALMTPLFGMGPGSDGLKGIKSTTDIFGVMKKAIEE